MPPRLCLALVVCLALVAGACTESRDRADSDVAPATTTLPALPTLDEECPHEWGWTPEQRANIEAFTGGRDDILAFNDCQRFLRGSRSSPAYGDVFAIFIADAAARSGAVPGEGEMTPVALVAAWGAYEPLEIDGAGFYCILSNGRSGPNALMAPAGPDADCLEPVVSEGVRLFTVRRNVPLEPPPATGDVPGVARWGFDGLPGRGADPEADGWVQYAVLPCGDAVCYVGPTGPQGSGAGFAPKPPRAVLASISPGLPAGGRVRAIDGWHDMQFLADPERTDGRTRPHEGLPVGVILPDDSLGHRTIDDFDDGWVRVAEVAISGASAYERKLNFSPTTGDRYNVVELCSYAGSGNGTGNCGGVPADVEARCAMTDPEDPTARRWRRRHVNARTGAARHYCVRFNPRTEEDAELEVPGIVRWKWLAEDEETWVRCGLGCCSGAG